MVHENVDVNESHRELEIKNTKKYLKNYKKRLYKGPCKYIYCLYSLVMVC